MLTITQYSLFEHIDLSLEKKIDTINYMCVSHY